MDDTKTYKVTTATGSLVIVGAGNISFTVSGDLVFENEARNFQETFAQGYWKHVSEIKESN
jgi:hypothetical protein